MPESFSLTENPTNLAILEFLLELSISISLGSNVSFLIRKSKSKRMHATPLLVIRVSLLLNSLSKINLKVSYSFLLGTGAYQSDCTIGPYACVIGKGVKFKVTLLSLN